MDSLAGKTLFVGIGAHKCGTTWLHTYLDGHPQVYMYPLKEAHYFDAKHRSDMAGFFNQKAVEEFQRAAGEDLLDKPADQGARHVQRLEARLDRLRMIYDPSQYMEFFRKRVPEDCTVFGEITPSYSTLGEAGFADIMGQHPDTRIIFLMRDPVDRFWSALKMRARNDGAFDIAASFHAELTRKRIIERSRYDVTLKAAQNVIPPDRLYVAFYEELFSDDALRSVCDFLGVDFQPGDYEERPNSSSTRVTLTPEMVAAARTVFQPVYDYVFEEFGERTPQRWRDRMAATLV